MARVYKLLSEISALGLSCARTVRRGTRPLPIHGQVKIVFGRKNARFGAGPVETHLRRGRGPKSLERDSHYNREPAISAFENDSTESVDFCYIFLPLLFFNTNRRS